MQTSSWRDRARHHFISEQGFAAPPTIESRAACYTALQFQARLVATTIAVGIGLQSAAVFLALAAVLAWSAAVPRRNLFDALHARLFGGRPGVTPVPPAPPPRRFAQAMASAFALTIGLALLLDWHRTAIAVQVVFSLAVGALVFGGFCLGAFTYHRLRALGRGWRRESRSPDIREARGVSCAASRAPAAVRG